ncbi:hypothetical protein PSA01_27130 [Pseudonocardia saturnea]|uniref:Uncharacterized protein n=1 Tax=Pseudonocardia saturnea TaxID=33909 RepID=A0ABQ0RYE1_9PSEU|nr:hypothetical protein Pdca_58230 [Pseudonocardia autotrophica]GEC25684.1 hypothetical protein PSA01_27130 [Pseudonocardia saturnea]
MGDLAGRVHPGVGASGHGQPQRHPQHGGQRIGEHPLHRAPVGLRGPAGEVGAVVGDVQPDPERVGNADGPAVRLDGGPVGVVRPTQESDPCCDGGFAKPAASAASSLANQTSATVRS